MQDKKNTTILSDDRMELLFRHAGLSEKQAKLYRILLADGEQRPAFLSRKSGIKRGNTYALLRDLKNRGLVSEFEKSKITYFRPEPPTQLLVLIAGREKDLHIARDLACDMVPRLTSQWKAAINRPIVQLYEGKEGMEKVFEDIYGPKGDDKVVWGCVDIERVHIEFPKQLEKKLIPMRRKYKWFAKSIFTDNDGGKALKVRDIKELRESYLVDGETYPLPAEIDIYDDKITLLSFEQQEFVGLIIQNAPFAQTLRSLFKLAYQAAQNPPKPARRQAQPVQASVEDPRPAQILKSPDLFLRSSDKTDQS